MNLNIYYVQPEDTIQTVAEKFHITVQDLMQMNYMAVPEVVVGQPLYVPYLRAYSASHYNRQLQYKPVTAYTADRPIIVNGEDINTGLYPVLNYQPEGAEYPYIYVPIAEFRRVGSRVVWDEEAQLLTVVTDYYELQDQIEDLKAQLYKEEAEIGTFRLIYLTEVNGQEVGVEGIKIDLWRKPPSASMPLHTNEDGIVQMDLPESDYGYRVHHIDNTISTRSFQIKTGKITEHVIIR